MLMHEVIYMMV